MTAANQDSQYRCPHCGAWYVVNTLLRAHIRKEHPNQG
jgi:hypothetical protein